MPMICWFTYIEDASDLNTTSYPKFAKIGQTYSYEKSRFHAMLAHNRQIESTRVIKLSINQVYSICWFTFIDDASDVNTTSHPKLVKIGQICSYKREVFMQFWPVKDRLIMQGSWNMAWIMPKICWFTYIEDASDVNWTSHPKLVKIGQTCSYKREVFMQFWPIKTDFNPSYWLELSELIFTN